MHYNWTGIFFAHLSDRKFEHRFHYCCLFSIFIFKECYFFLTSYHTTTYKTLQLVFFFVYLAGIFMLLLHNLYVCDPFAQKIFQCQTISMNCNDICYFILCHFCGRQILFSSKYELTFGFCIMSVDKLQSTLMWVIEFKSDPRNNILNILFLRRIVLFFPPFVNTNTDFISIL